MKVKTLQALNMRAFLSAGLILFLAIINSAYSQEIEFKKSSIKTGIGIGMNGGSRETGIGLVYVLGWQRSFGEKNKLRINPNMTLGGFRPFFISDTRDQFYRITVLGLNLHYDLVRYQAISLVTTCGGFMCYSRGLFGTGGWSEEGNQQSEFFHALYFGGNASIGLRIAPAKSKLAFEIRPVNTHFGTNHLGV